MTRKHYWFTSIAVVLACASTVFAETETTADELRNLFIQDLKACQDEDLDVEMSMLHSQAPIYLGTKKQSQSLFENFDLKYELMAFKYIGQDEDYAVARAKVKITKIGGPAFQNNETDTMTVFRKENGQWKIWDQLGLDTKYLNE